MATPELVVQLGIEDVEKPEGNHGRPEFGWVDVVVVGRPPQTDQNPTLDDTFPVVLDHLGEARKFCRVDGEEEGVEQKEEEEEEGEEGGGSIVVARRVRRL